MVIGHAFSSAYKEYLKTQGVTEETMEQEEYKYVLHSQVKSELEVNLLKDETKIKEVRKSSDCHCILPPLCPLSLSLPPLIPPSIRLFLPSSDLPKQAQRRDVGNHGH